MRQELAPPPETADERRELLAPEMDGPISLETCARCGDMVNDIATSGHLVECVAHLGEFTIQGTRYSNLAPHPDDPNADAVRDHCWMEGDQDHMDVAMADVMAMKALVSHQYDYGSTTELYQENPAGAATW